METYLPFSLNKVNKMIYYDPPYKTMEEDPFYENFLDCLKYTKDSDWEPDFTIPECAEFIFNYPKANKTAKDLFHSTPHYEILDRWAFVFLTTELYEPALECLMKDEINFKTNLHLDGYFGFSENRPEDYKYYVKTNIQPIINHFKEKKRRRAFLLKEGKNSDMYCNIEGLEPLFPEPLERKPLPYIINTVVIFQPNSNYFDHFYPFLSDGLYTIPLYIHSKCNEKFYKYKFNSYIYAIAFNKTLLDTIKKTDLRIPYIKSSSNFSTPDNSEYNFCGQVIDTKRQLIQVNGFLIRVRWMNGRFNVGDWIECFQITFHAGNYDFYYSTPYARFLHKFESDYSESTCDPFDEEQLTWVIRDNLE